MNVDTQNLTH